ncbi:MAG: hypothetical protein NTY30_02085 [Candidatus Berkelbacteria bacterium]|nr:hypothetical protein [Candidatus Berkelbacteria bacterium]
MKWKEILLKALDYIKKYRALWYLGILAALTEGASGGNFYGFNNGSGGNNSTEIQSSLNKVVDWISGNRLEVGVLLVAFILISWIILYISYSARAGLIYSIDQTELGEKKPEFHQAFHSGQKYFWRFLGLTLLIALMVFAVAFVLVGLIAICIVLAVSVSIWFLIVLIPLGLLLILGIILLSVYLNWILLLGYREIVIKNRKIIVAIKQARELVHHHFSDIILAWLIQAAIGIAAGIATAVVLLVVGGALFVIGAGIYFAGGLTAVIIHGSIASAAFIALTLLLAGIINAYISIYWTLIYRKLIMQ